MIPLANGINKIKKADLCHSPGIEVPMTGRPTFVIAHRFSTVTIADCIMVLEQGRIIERVTYIQLIVQKGRYYQLCTGNAIGA